MKKVDVISKLREIKARGFVRSTRRGDTGVGHTFEELFGVKENNISIPDIGGTVEIKTTRTNSQSMITLFTFNRAAWRVKQADVIRRYGIDAGDRVSLYVTLFCGRSAPCGLYVEIDQEHNTIQLLNDQNELIAEWDVYVIVGKFNTKLSRALLVVADTQISDDIEYFHYKSAFFLVEADVRAFIDQFRKGRIALDIRMHLPNGGSVRNHGTGFRCSLITLKDLYHNVDAVSL